jgi:hypothetical protein
LKMAPPPYFLIQFPNWISHTFVLFKGVTLTWINYLETWLHLDNTSCYYTGMGKIEKVGDLKIGNHSWYLNIEKYRCTKMSYRFIQNFFVRGQVCWDGWGNTIQYKLPMIPFGDISYWYC